ncbi:hypothetical protein [Helicobacter sp. T3_23-1059]
MRHLSPQNTPKPKSTKMFRLASFFSIKIKTSHFLKKLKSQHKIHNKRA